MMGWWMMTEVEGRARGGIVNQGLPNSLLTVWVSDTRAKKVVPNDQGRDDRPIPNIPACRSFSCPYSSPWQPTNYISLNLGLGYAFASC
jgi:hypothetical protein